MPMGGPLSLWEKPSCKKLRGPMGGTKSKPNAVDSIWNGGARERQNEGFEPSHGLTRLLP